MLLICDLFAGQSATTDKPMEFCRVTRSMQRDIPSVVTSGEGCKKDEKVERFHECTAGMLYCFRPCGIRLSHWEMYTAESLSLVFLSLLDAFHDAPHELHGIVYDRACDLHPFLKRLAREGNKDAERMLTNIDFMVDIWHAEKHTMAKCTLTDPSCLYHPGLAKFGHLKGMNTEAAEQSFRLLNPFKFITNRMTYGRRLLYLKLLDNFYNNKKIVELTEI